MRQETKHCKVGDLRPSQMIFSFGVGSIVDLPHLSTMIMGLDDWDLTCSTEISEERLLVAVRKFLGNQVRTLYTPPMKEGDDYIGVPVVPFPRWVRCPFCDLIAPLNSGNFALIAPQRQPDRTRYVHTNCNKAKSSPTVVPVRFLVACENGHIDDFPWVEYAHAWGKPCDAPLLRLREFGVSGEASDIVLTCETCKSTPRRMGDVFGEDARKDMPDCRCWHPHLRDRDEKGCRDEQKTPLKMKSVLLGASNSWFPITVSALSIPTTTDALKQLVTEHWGDLEEADSTEVIAYLRRKGKLRDFGQFDDDAVLMAVESKRHPVTDDSQLDQLDLDVPEWSAFTQPNTSPGSNDFRLVSVDPPLAYQRFISRVVLVERLREVRALAGFTRIGSPGEFTDATDIPEARRAPLSRKPPSWVPAMEVRGEGLFFQFDEDALLNWVTKVSERERSLFEAHCQWRLQRKLKPEAEGFPGIRYAVLHSFAHAMMRQISLECGYTAASIRERIYSRPPDDPHGPMAGVLLYTAAPDSEGTLGGLVSLGHPEVLVKHMDQAFEQMHLCASDPLCAEHQPKNHAGVLHGAACHACLFSPETSCERGNRYLDRALLVRTFGSTTVSFFEG